MKKGEAEVGSASMIVPKTIATKAKAMIVVFVMILLAPVKNPKIILAIKSN